MQTLAEGDRGLKRNSADLIQTLLLKVNSQHQNIPLWSIQGHVYSNYLDEFKMTKKQYRLNVIYVHTTANITSDCSVNHSILKIFGLLYTQYSRNTVKTEFKNLYISAWGHKYKKM